MRSRWRRLYHYARGWILRSPLGFLCVPLNVTLDDLTKQIVRCRVLFEERVARGEVDAELLRRWEQRLEQMEWEHVRRLQRAGRGGDPFVRGKTGGRGGEPP